MSVRWRPQSHFPFLIIMFRTCVSVFYPMLYILKSSSENGFLNKMKKSSTSWTVNNIV